ncbi:MAG TPA: hypothetical protein VKR57_09525 [Terriglobales bacterium]|nr:hypothetical protein [Terriglobales bacterium]
MKTTLFRTTFCVLFLICATTAFAQTAPVLSNQANIVQIIDHPEHASQHELATSQNLLEHSDYAYAKGELPLWEFGPVGPPPVPLGDLARAARKEHALDKKAQIIWEK